MINTGRSKMLESGYFENGEVYAHRVQELQYDLGLEVESFDNIGMSATSFLWEIARKEDSNSNSNQEGQQVSEEQYSDDYNYEQDRLTDDNAYSEYFRDDFNAGDRFTS